MTRLLLIAPTCDGTDVGEAWVAFNWARRLGERYDTTLLTYHKRNRPPAIDLLPGLRIVEWRETPLVGMHERLNSMMKPGYFEFYWRARRWIRQALSDGERFDIAFQPVPVAMRYPSPAAGLDVPFVLGPIGGGLTSLPAFQEEEGTSPWFVRLRGFDGWRLRHDWLLRRTYESADCVLGIGPYVREQLADLDLQRFEVMSETGLPELPPLVSRANSTGPIKLLYVGRLVRTKGARDAIRALRLVPDLDIVFDVVGDGPDRAACEAEATQLGVRDRVVFHGAQPRDEVNEKYRAADVFVFPSYREPGGNVVPEAMGFGLPSIVCDRGGPGLATSDECAIRLRADSPQTLAADIAKALRTLVSNPELRDQMGAAARERARTHLMWDNRIADLESLFNDIASTRS